MKKRSFSPPIFPIALSTLVVIVPVVFYLSRFGSLPPSKHLDDWVEFSRYLAPFATLFSGCAIVFLTWWIYKDRTAIEMPLITFRRTIKLEIGFPNHPFYEMVNGGRSS